MSDEEERRKRIIEKHDAEIARQEAIAEKRELYSIPDSVEDEDINDFIAQKRAQAEQEAEGEEAREEALEEEQAQKQREIDLHNQKKAILDQIQNKLNKPEMNDDEREIISDYFTGIDVVKSGRAKSVQYEWQIEGDKLVRRIKFLDKDGKEVDVQEFLENAEELLKGAKDE